MSDRSSADDAGHAPSALETELRAALHERGAGITTATLLRPDPPGLPEFLPRRPVPRWRIVGAVAAVSVVILAVVLGRGVMAPQQVHPAGSQDSTESSWVGFDTARLTDRVWAATDIENRNTGGSIGAGFTLWNGSSGSLPTTVEFHPDGSIAFNGAVQIVGTYSLAGSPSVMALTVDGARRSDKATDSRGPAALVSLNPNALLLEGMPGRAVLEAGLVGDQLMLSRGNTTIRYRAAGVTPAAAGVAGSVGYPIVAGVSGRWRTSDVRVGGEIRAVPAASSATLALTPAGTFEIFTGSSMLLGRWWATSTGLVTADNSITGTFRVSTGTTQRVDVAGLPIPQGETPRAVQEVLSAFAYGQVLVSVTAQGQLVITDKGVPGSSVTFVRG